MWRRRGCCLQGQRQMSEGEEKDDQRGRFALGDGYVRIRGVRRASEDLPTKVQRGH